LSDVNTVMEMGQSHSNLKTSISGMQSTVTDRTYEGTEVSQWSMKMNDCDHGRSDSASLCSYNSGNENCCGCPDCLELALEHTWKSERLCIFHCNGCGGTTVRETRSLYIDGRLKHSYSMNPIRHECHCCHCGILNSDSGTASNHKNTHLLDAKNLDSHNQTISNTSILTSVSGLCKYSTPSCSYHSQKHNFFIQSKHSENYNENFRKYAKGGECNCLAINESQIGSLFMHKPEVEIGVTKLATAQETSFDRSTSVAIPMASLKDETKSNSNEQMGSEKLLDNEILLTPTAGEVIDHQLETGYNMKAGKPFLINPLGTAFGLKCEMMKISKKILKTAKQISETGTP
ncbi:unnamed protein product, partial [Cercopithifilaria johnstoni]